jgi:hypothetical protein
MPNAERFDDPPPFICGVGLSNNRHHAFTQFRLHVPVEQIAILRWHWRVNRFLQDKENQIGNGGRILKKTNPGRGNPLYVLRVVTHRFKL